MRRTYRSKKDTTSGIERRDLFQNLDGKSAPYDAFSIQNIKQTKRELSYTGSLNLLGVASSRVRKKKFVKRITKEPVNVCRESMSPSAYLTPDKSIRVNKILDPFDLLLMSSPAGPVKSLGNKNVESVTDKNDLFDEPVLKKQGKAYTRQKKKTIKKFNYSSSGSSDTDKENSDDRPNITQNTSDIRAHKLLVEQEVNITPKRIDDSINNIVNNLSLINKLKHKYSANESINRSLRVNRHRLTRDILTPMLQKSPLSSTPFKAKYRGDSIFKFSPIAASTEDNLKYKTIVEDQDDSNCSVVLLGKAKDDSHRFNVEDTDKPVLNLVANANNEVKEISNIDTHSIMIPSVEVSSFQTTETEPFLGFSHEAISKIVPESENDVVRLSDLDDSNLKTDITQIEISNNDQSLKDEYANNDTMPDNDVNDTEVTEESQSYSKDDNYIGDASDEDNSLSLHAYNDKDSLYDTCTSDQSFIEADEVKKEPLVLLQRMNDSSFMKYYDKMKHEYIKTDENDASLNSEIEDGNYSKISTEIGSEIESENDDNDASSNSKFEDSNDSKISNNISSDVDDIASINSLLENNNDTKISTEMGSDVANDTDENDFSLNSNIEDSNCSNKSGSGIESETNESVVKYEDDYDEEIISNDGRESSNNEEEKYMSFVTTRRRHEVTNNSMMSMFNDSYSSSSTNCDKTVLNNKGNKSDINIDSNNSWTDFQTDKEVDDRITDSEHATINESRISFVTSRSSNVTERKSSIQPRKSSINSRNNAVSIQESELPRESFKLDNEISRMSSLDAKPGIVLRPGKKWERSLSIYRRMTMMNDCFDKSILDEPTDNKGRKYRQSIISTMEMQEYNSSLHNESINNRRSTFVSKPSRSKIRIIKDPDSSRLSLCNTTVFEDLQGFLNEECDDTIIELSKLSIADQTHEVTVLDNFHDTSNRIAAAKDYVLRRCNQTDVILFDECYPDTVLKNCHKIGEGVYGEVFLWRDRDGRARVLKIVPIAGNLKVNGESQKDFHEIISEIVIAMELSALRAPIAEIERHFDEGKDVEALDLHTIENATDVFNEVLAVRCVYGSYPSRLLDLWDLYDECKGSENDNPAILPIDQQYIVLELANAGQDLESYQFNNAEQAHALFLQVAYGLAVAEEAFQFEHRDLHWGNVLISPTEQKWATFVIRGRAARVARCGVSAAIIDYSLSRVALRPHAVHAAHAAHAAHADDVAALYNDLAHDDELFNAVGDYQFQVYRLMRDKLRNDWKNFEPYTNILWLHYTVDKMITALRYKRTNTKIHKHYIDKLKGIKSRILDYGSAAQFVLTDNEI